MPGFNIPKDIPQADRIRKAIEKSLKSRDSYTEYQVKKMLEALKEAEKNVKAEIVHIKEKSIISKGLEIRQSQLQVIQKEIEEIARELKNNMSLIAKESMNGAFKNSFTDGVNEFADMGVPRFSKLTQAEKIALAKKAFSQVDRKALDFLINYELQLLGSVSNFLSDEIKNHIIIGLIQGDSIAKISQNIGGIITDPESFRRAGKTVFKTAQLRTETIVRTETLRAYNQGRLKFFEQVGVKYVIWLSVGDKRMCPVCRELDGNRYLLSRMPGIPRHAQCRCSYYTDPESLEIKERQSVVKAESTVAITDEKNIPIGFH